MSDLKSQVIEKSEMLITNPTTQKVIAGYSIGSGGAMTFELVQGWLGIVSVTIGIIAGLLVIRSNYRKAQGLEIDNQIKRMKLEAEIKRAVEKECES